VTETNGTHIAGDQTEPPSDVLRQQEAEYLDALEREVASLRRSEFSIHSSDEAIWFDHHVGGLMVSLEIEEKRNNALKTDNECLRQRVAKLEVNKTWLEDLLIDTTQLLRESKFDIELTPRIDGIIGRIADRYIAARGGG